MPITLNHSNISVQYSSDKSYIIETVKSDLYRRNEIVDTIVRDNLQTAPVIPIVSIQEGSNIYAVESYTYSGSANTADFTRVFPKSTTCDILIIGGGGGGGARFGGGGGAGLLIYKKNVSLNGNISIKVGKGGLGGQDVNTGSAGNKGESTIVITSTETLTAIGGGGGAYEQVTDVTAKNGGSGGGGNWAIKPAGTGSGDNITTFGNNGGAGYFTGANGTRVNGGGGGAGGSGKGGGLVRPDGGRGKEIDITGTSIYYAAGGGGANSDYDATGYDATGRGGELIGGGGGGGDGGESNPLTQAQNGADNRGSGGGGGVLGYKGGNGGSGIVIIRYLLGTIPANNFLTTEPIHDIYQIETYRYYGTNNQATYTKTFLQSTVCDILIIGGGGGGGARFGGGGGAGLLIYKTNITLQGNITINVGKGGLGGQSDHTSGSSGQSTTFVTNTETLTATGGGGGGSESTQGINGGSGGGTGYRSGYDANNNALKLGGTGSGDNITTFGNNGGAGYFTGATGTRVNGGGGGAGGSGKGGGLVRPDGGRGKAIDITGKLIYYAAGGGGANSDYDTFGYDATGRGGELIGGGWNNNGRGGAGDGGESNPLTQAQNGADNSGSGGGGGVLGYKGGNGGSGVVIIRYKKNAIQTGDSISSKILNFNYVQPLTFTYRTDESPYSWQEAYNEAIANGKRMPTITELRNHITNSPSTFSIWDGTDKWLPVVNPAVANSKDWVQIGSGAHTRGRSHTQDLGTYPSWGDNNDYSLADVYFEVADNVQRTYSINFPTRTFVNINNIPNLILQGSYNIYHDSSIVSNTGVNIAKPTTSFTSFTVERMYPPVRNFTAATTTVSSQTYGNGIYTITYSSFYTNFEPFKCFNESDTGGGHWASNKYNASGNYIITNTGTESFDDGSYKGEWLKINLPIAIKLTKYILKQRPSMLDRSPRKFRIYGSNDDSNWDLLIDRSSSNISYDNLLYTDSNFNIFNTYRFFAIVVSDLIGNTTVLNFDEWYIYGQEVLSGSLSISYSTLNPTLDPIGAQWTYSSNNTNVYHMGSVGIGTTSPEYPLDVRGNIFSSTGGYTSSTLTKWSVLSDRRIKENIVKASYDKCLENVKNIELYNFNFKDNCVNTNDRHQLGFIAQEVQQVYPKAVEVGKMIVNLEQKIDDLLTLNITQIDYTLYGAVKSLIEKIENIKIKMEHIKTTYDIP
jgi:hypothetical protein